MPLRFRVVCNFSTAGNGNSSKTMSVTRLNAPMTMTSTYTFSRRYCLAVRGSHALCTGMHWKTAA